MDFPIQSLIDEEQAEAWVLNHFHPQGLCCPKCQASVAEARNFRKTETRGLQVYRCKRCASVYNLYSQTVFAGEPTVASVAGCSAFARCLSRRFKCATRT